MAKVFLSLADARIAVIAGAAQYVESFANFSADSGHEIPPLPQAWQSAGVASLRYDDATGKLVASDGDSQREVQSAAWKQRLDWAIGAIDSLLAAQAARAPAPNAPPPESFAARMAAAEEAIAALEARVAALETGP